MEERLHYQCQLRLNETVVFVVWYSGERDGFLRDDSHRLLVARTPSALAAIAKAHDVELVKNDAAEYDFDRIRAWCLAPETVGIDCPSFLNAWNFFDDLAELSTGIDTPYTRKSRSAAACYDKLLWGCNLIAVTPPGERFEPVWQPAELAEIRQVLVAGLDLFVSELCAAK